MKKVIMCSLIILLTGCNSEALEGYITTECVKVDNYNDIINTNTITIKNKDNNVTNVIYSYKYETDNTNILDSYKQSLIAESNQYKNSHIFINSNESENSFEMIYELDMETVDEKIKEDFTINEKANVEISNLKKKGYVCK